jgi:hypothetical protein
VVPPAELSMTKSHRAIEWADATIKKYAIGVFGLSVLAFIVGVTATRNAHQAFGVSIVGVVYAYLLVSKSLVHNVIALLISALITYFAFGAVFDPDSPLREIVNEGKVVKKAGKATLALLVVLVLPPLSAIAAVVKCILPHKRA